MAFAERFEELKIWQEARRLNKLTYLSLKACQDWSFRDQFRRAALSVMNNIAEGFERRTSKDFSRFLDIAKGSSGEVRSMTYAAEDVSILSEEAAIEIRSAYETLSKRIASFHNSLNR